MTFSSSQPQADGPERVSGATNTGPVTSDRRAPISLRTSTQISERRLHPAYLIVGAGRTIRALIPAVAVTIFGLPAWVFFILGGLVLAGAVASWWTTRYAVVDQVLRVRSGILTKSVQTIAATRITSLDTERGLVQRLFGVWSVKVQSPGDGAKATAELVCLSGTELDRLREVLVSPWSAASGSASRLGGSGTNAAQPSPDPPGPNGSRDTLAVLDTKTLVIAALTGTSIPLILAGFFAVWNRLREVLPESTMGFLEREVFGHGTGTVIVLAALFAVAVVVGVTLAALRLARFTLRRHTDQLRTSRGLLTQRTGTIAVDRVQAVRLVDGLWRRMLGYTAIQVEVAGIGGSRDDSDRVLFPLLRKASAAPLIAQALPELGWLPRSFTAVPARGRRRYLTAPVVLTAPLAVLGLVFLPGWVWLSGIPVVLGVLVGLAQSRAAGWSLDDATVVIRSRRILAIHTVIARVNRVQISSVHTNPLQRRAGLATVTLSLSSGRQVRLRHLSRADADLLLHTVGRRFSG